MYSKNIIDLDGSLLILKGHGLIPKVFNSYQIRISHEEYNKFYDWYHTSGTLTVVSEETGTSKIAVILEVGAVAEFIIKHLRS